MDLGERGGCRELGGAEGGETDLYERRIYLKENLVFNLKGKVYSKSQMIL